jgi:succinate-semialdehyde dehydrogenase/glutarate-semialdehyde dehydrogenase
MGYVDTQLFINGQWQQALEGRTLPVVNPATGTEIGRVAHAGRPDLDRALEAAQKGSRSGATSCRPSAARSCAGPPR